MTQEINATNVFYINRSELEGRIDPHQYHYERKEAIRKLKENRDVVKLSRVVKNVKKITSEINDTDIYVGLENIVSNTGEYIATNEKQSISSAGIFKKGQILFPKLRPYLNKVYLAEFDGICSTEFFIFDSSDFLNEFLAIYLRSDLIVNQTKHLMTGNTLPRLQTEDIYNLPIPRLSKGTQQEIINFYNSVYTQKQKKEAEAKELLASIDTYLLNELGIVLPETLTGLENRIFISNFSEVAGLRLDPLFLKNTATIKSDKFKSVPLKKIVTIAKGQSITKDKITAGKYPVIAGGQSSPYSIDSFNFEGNIITISASGAYSGYVWYHDYPIFASDCIVLAAKDESSVSTKFIYLVLKLLQQEIYKLQQGAGQPHVYARDIEKILIPIPSLSEQGEILNNVHSIQQKINQLQTEAQEVLAAAKEEVERMILG